jgi:hypothetical protein
MDWGDKGIKLMAVSIYTHAQKTLTYHQSPVKNDTTPNAVHCVIIATIWEDYL